MRPGRPGSLAPSFLLLTACSSSAVLREAAALSDEIDRAAQRACGVTDAVVRAAEEDGVEAGEAAACFTQLRVEFDDCAQKALDKYPSEARGLLACIRRDQHELIDCCGSEGTCSYAGIETCYGVLWDGASSGECDVDAAPIEAAIDSCRGRAEDPGYQDPCADATFRSISYDTPNEFGASPADTLAKYAGSCSAKFHLEPNGGQTTVPETADGQLDVSVQLDPSSARLVIPSKRGGQRGCQRHVEVRMHVRVKTSDGLLDEEEQGVLSYAAYGLIGSTAHQDSLSTTLFSLSIPEEQITGSLGLHAREPGALALLLAPQPLSEACEGKIWVSRTSKSGSGATSAGWWSPSGCRPSYMPNTCSPEF